MAMAQDNTVPAGGVSGAGVDSGSASGALLDIRGVTVNFGGNRAVDNVSLPVHEGSLTGLIGPNGAGKTTLFNVISGLLSPSSGSVYLEGRNISKVSPNKRAHLGLSRTFQRLELFTSLTVRENIQVAGEISRRMKGGYFHIQRETDRIIELIDLGDVANSEVTEIPTGLARVVEMGRALMNNPTVLLLDEPASGQTEEETQDFGKLLLRLKEEGTTIFLVEHDMALVMSVCDIIHVLDFGQIIARGAPQEIQTMPEVLDAYLGSHEMI